MFQGGLFLIGFVLAIVLAIFTLVAFLRGRLGIRSFVFWILLSLVLAGLSLFPQLIDWLAFLISVRVRGLFVLTIGLLVAYILVYASYLSQRTTEKTVQRLSQEVSLLRYRLEYNDDEGTHADSSDHLSSE
jgi:hypothetical protein